MSVCYVMDRLPSVMLLWSGYVFPFAARCAYATRCSVYHIMIESW